METFPSVYSKTRRRALEHTLDRFHNDKYPNVPYFLFGDFNFRTDTASVIKKLTEDTQERRLSNKGSISKLQFHNKDDDLILTLGKKEFSHYEHQNVFMQNGGQWLREYDRELDDFDGRLLEFPIKFVPSYPFEEDINEGSNYMQTRVPAWCDRVLLSPTAKLLVQDVSSPDAVDYGIIGPTTCMGDHKPVYLRASLILDEGMINCCSLPSAPEFCFRVPNNYVELFSMLPDYSSCVSGQVNYTDRSSNLLHAAPIKHDPYTPDSMDSPSPNAIMTASTEVPDVVDVDNINNVSTLHFTQASNIISRRMDRAVSPALLKSKLELIVRSKKEEDTDQDFADIKRNPSDCCLHSWSNADERESTVRRNRCNSDVSWQRSHLLTEAWVQGKGQQAYRSFRDFVNRSSLDSTPPNGVEGLSSDLIIPRISIINASNFVSNESSVYLHEDKYSNYSDNKLTTYSDGRTKSLSGEAFSSGKSDELKKTDDENNRLSSKKLEINESVYLQNISELITKQDKDTCAMIVGTNLFEKEDQVNEETMLDVKEKRLNKVIDSLQSIEDNNSKNQRTLAEDPVLDKPSVKSRVTSLDKSAENLGEYNAEQIGVHLGSIEADDKLEVAESFAATIYKEAEILKCDRRGETIVSRQTTRSNSVQSQDTSDNTGDVRMKLKAFDATEKSKQHNIVEKESKCEKCCCIVS
ncbi:Type I inositol 1,4,5-trisphosphate 5-phosphatase [Habropoda laboriosa]|uniref:inositol-polyphosphate 5-phosphatase n=1 Tax=Habropoda laboriosa TaxID=597456 RepID=A0A0L7QKQ3_9HYME|nr:Type I inositol 1,4,5-trisphosphate 5-phosphatase [Habropoda laboriosa]